MHIPHARSASPTFDEQERSLRKLARRLIGEIDAEDLVQETWVAALESGWQRSLEKPAWLRAVLRKQILFARRSAARRRHREERSARPEALEGARSDADERAIRERLLAAVETLREPERSVIRLRYWDELCVTEIAQRLGRPHDTVKGQLRRGLLALRGQLDRESRGNREGWVLALTRWIDSRELRPTAPSRPLSAATMVVTGAGILGTSWALLALHVAGAARDLVPGMNTDGTRSLDAMASAPASESHDPARRATDGGVSFPAMEEQAISEQLAPAAAREWILRAVDASGTPIEGAHVFVNGRRRQAITDSTGCARLVVEADASNDLAREFLPGRITFFAEHPGFLRTTDHHVVPEHYAAAELTLTFDHVYQTVRGRVRSRSGEPLAGAKIGLFDNDDAFQTRADGAVLTSPEEKCESDAEGRFEVPGWIEGGNLIRVEKEGCAPFVDDVAGAADSKGEVNIVLGPGVPLTGVVRDRGGNPLPGASVRFSSGGGVVWHEAKTDEHGRYATATLPPGEHLLWAFHPEIASRYLSTHVTAMPGQELVWSPSLRDHSAFRIHVLDPDGRPVAGLLCQVQGEDWYDSHETDERGSTAAFTVYPDMPVTIVIRDPHCPNAMPLVTLDDLLAGGEDVEVRLPVGSRDAAPIRGILHAWDGRPPGDFALNLLLEHSRMSMPWFQIDAPTGAFQTAPQPPGQYIIAVCTRSNGLYVLPPFVVSPGEPVDLGVQCLPTPGQLAVRARGRAASASSISLEHVHQIGPRTTYLLAGIHPLDEGAIELDLLPASYRVRAWRDDLELASATVSIVSGTKAEIVLE